MKCNQNTDRLSAWLDGELDESASAALDAHLEECSVCRARLEELQLVDSKLNTTLRAEALLAAEVSRRALTRIQQIAETNRGSGGAASGGVYSSFRMSSFTWLASLAASLLLGFYLGSVLVRPERQGALSLQSQADPRQGTPLQHTPPVLPVAKLQYATGSIEIAEPNSLEYFACPADCELPQGSKMRTGGQFKCELKMTSGGTIRLDCNTEVTIPDQNELVLEKGRIYCAPDQGSASGLKIKSGSMTIEVDQALCNVSRTENAIELLPLRGRVHVEDGTWETAVSAGEKLEFSGSSEPRVQPAMNPILETRWLNDILSDHQDASGEIEQRVEMLLAEIGYSKVRYLLEEELRCLGSRSVQPLIAFLRSEKAAHSSANQRHVAAQLVQDLSEYSHIPELLTLLETEDPQVRFAAAIALRRLIGQDLAGTPEQWKEAAAEERADWLVKYHAWLRQRNR